MKIIYVLLIFCLFGLVRPGKEIVLAQNNPVCPPVIIFAFHGPMTVISDGESAEYRYREQSEKLENMDILVLIHESRPALHCSAFVAPIYKEGKMTHELVWQLCDEKGQALQKHLSTLEELPKKLREQFVRLRTTAVQCSAQNK